MTRRPRPAIIRPTPVDAVDDGRRNLGLVSGFWQWLEDASQGQATFIGSLISSSIGLIALLLGALFNAHLNRRRDNHLRREERETVAAALLAELVGIRNAFQESLSC